MSGMRNCVVSQFLLSLNDNKGGSKTRTFEHVLLLDSFHCVASHLHVFVL